jgi:uncharacterized sulfatase
MTKRRQVVFIMTDTQRWDMLGCYEDNGLKTPCLDRLAEGGMRFEKAYTCQPVCGPARSAIFTGTFPHSNGSWGNTMPLGDTVKHLGQRLESAGIRSAYIGKWHLDGGDYFGMGRCPDGWDREYWYDMRNYLDELTPEDRQRSRVAETNRDGIDAGFTYAYRCSDRAMRFLDDHGNEDFLLTVSYDEPHHPFLCPEPYASMYKDYDFPKKPGFYDDLSNKPEHQRVWAGSNAGQSREERDGLSTSSPDYFGCHSFVDHEIGRVVDHVRKKAPNALIIFTSDHGDLLNYRGMSGKGPAAYDDITHIPLIVNWPGHVAEGSVCDHPVSHIDLTPTMLDYFRVPPSKVLEGKSLIPCFKDSSLRVNEYIFIEFGRYEIDHDSFGALQLMRCAYDGRYKLAINLLSSDELYDLESDPGELENLIESAEYIGIRDRLHDRIVDWMNETRDPFRGDYWARRPWRKDSPAATWNFTNYTRQRDEDEGYEPRQLDYVTGLEMRAATRKK